MLTQLGGKSTYGAITKLLYIADRESIRERGRPITGDEMYALPHGPILSVVLDRMNGSHPQFRDFVEQGENYEVTLIKAEEASELTFADLRVLDRVLKEYGKLSWDELKAATHAFPEWKKFDRGQDTYSIISIWDVAEGLGLSDEQSDELGANIREHDAISCFLSSLKDSEVAAV